MRYSENPERQNVLVQALGATTLQEVEEEEQCFEAIETFAFRSVLFYATSWFALSQLLSLPLQYGENIG